MRWLRVVALITITAMLQVSLMGALRITNVVPNLVVVLIVSLVAWGAASEALLAAVVAGLVMDLSSIGTFGLAASSLIVIALGLVALRQLGFDGQVWPTRLGLVVVATVAWWFIHVAALGSGNFGLLATWRILLTEIIVNCFLASLIPERLIRGKSTV